jgi:hypothetical protein
MTSFSLVDMGYQRNLANAASSFVTMIATHVLKSDHTPLNYCVYFRITTTLWAADV